MSEVILSRRSGTFDYSNNAILRVYTESSVVLTVTNGDKTYTKTNTVDGGFCDFTVTYGTWSVSGTYNGKTKSTSVVVSALQIYTITLKVKSVTYGISIDMSNTDPYSAVTYTDDAAGFTPLSVNSSKVCSYGSWADIITDMIGCKPCLYDNGTVTYLNPNNYAYTSSGSSADITSGNSGDVMVQFKKTWYKFAKSGSTLTFQITDDESKASSGFVTTAFTSMNSSSVTVKDYMYYSAYEGYNSSNKIRSLSGKTPTDNISFINSQTYCKATGSTYGMEDWAKRCYILGLLMLVTKSRGIQAKIGQGYLDSNSAALTTGTMNTNGLFYGDISAGKTGVKCFGIENMWGSMYNWCDGIFTMSSTTVGLKGTVPYNTTGSGYTTITDGNSRGSWLYPTQLTPYLSGAVVFPTTTQSSSTVGWPDGFSVHSLSGYCAVVGGYWDRGVDRGGPFCLHVYYHVSSTGANLGPRLVAA